MKSLFITVLLITLTSYKTLLGQVSKDSLDYYETKVLFHETTISNNQIYDTGCYQHILVNSRDILITDPQVHCYGKMFSMFFPLKYTSTADTNRIDTLEFLEIYDGLSQFKEPILWKTTNVDSTIRISFFRDTIPIVYRFEKSNGSYQIIKKKGTCGTWFWDINKNISIEYLTCSQKKLNKIVRNLKQIIDKHKSGYPIRTLGKNIVIEICKDGYEYAITDDLILSLLKLDRKFKRTLNLIEKQHIISRKRRWPVTEADIEQLYEETVRIRSKM